MMCLIRSKKLPRWIGMCSAWHSVSPAALNSAVEQSRRSLTLAECEARISVSPVSSTIEAMAAPMTSTVMEGSWAADSLGPLTPPPAARAPPHAERGEEGHFSCLRLEDEVEIRVDP